MVDLPNRLAVALDLLAKCGARRGVAAHAHLHRHSAHCFLGTGQLVRLPVVGHLQAMLDLAQEPVGVEQLAVVPRGKIALLLEPVQCVHGSAAAQEPVLSAVEPLETLDEELDVANPAGVELDVERSAPPPAVLLNAVPGLGDLVDLREVGGRLIDPGPQPVEELPAQLEVSARRPGLEEHLQLPVPSPVEVVVHRRRDRQDQLSGPAFGTQPQVDPVDEARSGLERKDVREAQRQTLCKIRVRCHLGARRRAVPGIDVHQVDVRTVIEFASPKLAHREDREIAHDLSPFRRAEWPAVAVHQLLADVVVRSLDDDVRKVRQLKRDVRQRSHRQQVPHGDAQHVLRLESSQFQGRRLVVRIRGDHPQFGPQLAGRDRALQVPRIENPPEQRGRIEQDVREVATVAESRQERVDGPSVEIGGARLPWQLAIEVDQSLDCAHRVRKRIKECWHLFRRFGRHMLSQCAEQLGDTAAEVGSCANRHGQFTARIAQPEESSGRVERHAPDGCQGRGLGR